MLRSGLVYSRKVILGSKHISVNLFPELSASWYIKKAYDVCQSTQIKNTQCPLLLPHGQSLIPIRRHLMDRGSRSLFSIKQTLQDSHPLLSTGHGLQAIPNSTYASNCQMPRPADLACDFINMARCIDLGDLKDAPPPAFWVTVATAAIQLGIPFLELVGGYCPIMTYLQLYIAAAGLAWNGGQTWGLAISSPKPSASWDTMHLSLIPTGFAILGLILPYPLGFLTVASGLVVSFYRDLKNCVYPHWAMAAKFLVALSSTIGLLLALMAYVLFHNRKNAKKKKSGKDISPAKSTDYGSEGVVDSGENVKNENSSGSL